MCVCVCAPLKETAALSVLFSHPASCAEAQLFHPPILMNVVKLVRRWDPGCFLSGLLRLNLMCRQMMYWKPSHQGVTHMSPGCLALRCLLSLCVAVAAVVVGGAEGGVAGCGLGRGCIFFGELRVSAVWILQAVAEGVNRLSLSFSSSPPFLQGRVCSQRRFCD